MNLPFDPNWPVGDCCCDWSVEAAFTGFDESAADQIGREQRKAIIRRYFIFFSRQNLMNLVANRRPENLKCGELTRRRRS